MNIPEYENNSIVNLMASILNSFGLKNHYNPLFDFNLNFTKYKNVMFIVLDGLGYNFVNKQKNSILNKSLLRKITSVFPTTTTSALTSFLTSEAPLQHAMTAWHIYFKELGCVSLSLPFCARFNEKSYEDLNISPSQIFNYNNIFDQLNIPYQIISPKKTINTAYSNYSLSSKNKIAYENNNDFFEVISKAIKNNLNNKSSNNNIIYAYNSSFDESAHKNGINSDATKNLFLNIDNSFSKLKNEFQNNETLFIITADHGLIDVSNEKKLYLKDFPILASCLSLPLCGEARVPFCYIRPFKIDIFENYVQEKMSNYCNLLSIEEAIEINLFGIGKINPKFYDRVGDYILLMKDNYVLIDTVLNEKEHSFIGYHGGLSDDELYVPLIIF